MLKLFRNKNMAKFVLWALLILIMPAFVLWGTGSLGGSHSKGPKFVGTIEGKKISFDYFAESLGSIRCHILLGYFNRPQIMETLLKNKPLMGKLAWDRLIMVVEAKRYKLKASDAEVINFIRSHPIFSTGGMFDDRIYAYVLKNNLGVDPRDFEEMVRGNIIIRKLNDNLTKGITVTDEEVLESYEKDYNKFKVSYVIFEPGAFLDKVKVEDPEIKGYYDTHKDEFLLPAKEGQAKSTEPAYANFEDVKEGIQKALAEYKARASAYDYANGKYKELDALMKKNSVTFEKAAAELGLKTQETPLFAKPDYLEGIGDALTMVEAASKMKKDDIAHPVETRRGAIIFRLSDIQKFDDNKFKSDKVEYAKKILENKKNAFLENWLRKLELGTTVNIDIGDYEKYYR